MTDTARSIRIVIDPNPARKGSDQTISELERIVSHSNKMSSRMAANNNEIGKSFGKMSAPIGSVKTALDQAQGAVGGFSSALDGAGSRVGSFTTSLSGIARLGLPGVIAAGTMAILALGAAGIKAASQVETFKANLTTVTGSVEAADSAYRALVTFAGNTPFDLGQSIEGFTKLRALGLATSTEIMTSYGNTAAAMGKSMNQMIEAVADATTGEFERLKEFGIKARQEGDKVAFTFQGVTTTVGKNANDIQKYLVGIGNTNFGGAMARQMDTLNGAFANLEDNVFQLMANLGDGPLNDGFKKIVNGIANGVAAIGPLLGGVMDVVGGLLDGFVELGSGILQVFTVSTGGAGNFKSILDGLGIAFSMVGEVFSIVGTAIGQTIGGIANVAGKVVGAIYDTFSGLLSWLGLGWQSTGQSVTESIVGFLRAAKYVASNITTVFAAMGQDVLNIFSSIGQAVSAAMNGDFSKVGKVSLDFGQTKKTVAGIATEAGKIWGDQKGNRAWLDNKLGKGTGSLDFAAMGGDTAAAGKPDKSAASEAERKAKAQKEFWQGLEKELELSKLTGIQAAIRSKELDYQKIVGRDITADEKTRLATFIKQTETNKFLQSAEEEHRKKMLDIANEEKLFQAEIGGATKEQLAIQRAIQDTIASAQRANVTLSELELELLKKKVSEEAKRNAELQRRKDNLSAAMDAAGQYSAAFQTQQETERNKAIIDGLKDALASGKIDQVIYDQTVKGMDQASKDTAGRFYDEFATRIGALGDQFGGAFGKALNGLSAIIGSISQLQKGNFSGMGAIGGIASVAGFGGVDAKGNVLTNKLGTAFGDKASSTLKGLFDGETWKNPLKSMTDGFGDFGKTLKDTFSVKGQFMTGLGKMLGAAGAGAQIGDLTNSVLGAIGLNLDKTGSSVGGAIGGLALGPLGAIGGSILGGLIGGLFKKTPMGKAIITGVDPNQLSVSGNKDGIRENLSAAGKSVQAGVQAVADAFGASVGGFNVSIGQRDDYFRVSKSGSDAVGNKTYPSRLGYDMLYNGKDAEEAVKIAIRDAVSDGALIGVSDFTKRIITNDTNLDRALTIAKSYEDVLTQLTTFKNPIKGAVDASIKSIDQLIVSMEKAGATTAELANMEEYRSLKLGDVMKSQLAGFQGVLDMLDGEAGGFSGMSLLNKNLSEMDKFKAQIDAGQQVDQDAFTALMEKVVNGVTDIYGANSAAGQSILNNVRNLTNGAMDIAKSEFAKASDNETVRAILDSGGSMVDQQVQTNAILSNLYDAIMANGWSGQAAQAVSNQNGQVTYAY